MKKTKQKKLEELDEKKTLIRMDGTVKNLMKYNVIILLILK